jgi:hypothetical protein
MYSWVVMKRHWLTALAVMVLVLLAAVLLLFSIRSTRKQRLQAKREAAYASALRSYTDVLKPGMTRKEVEDYFHANKIEIGQMCCVDFKNSAGRQSWDDLAQIGREGAPWFCGRHSVYIAFQFTDHEKHPAGMTVDDDLDTLRAITVYHALEGCL